MARWRLRGPHYLNIIDPDSGQPTAWEYREQDRNTGKMARKVYDVPQLLDPKDPTLCNYPGEIIVCHEGKGEGRDITFFGAPTPDMEPLDDEAERISAGMTESWEHPIDSLPANGGMDSKEQAFMETMMKAFAGAGAQSKHSEVDDLRKQLDELRALIATQSPSSPIPDESPKPRRA